MATATSPIVVPIAIYPWLAKTTCGQCLQSAVRTCGCHPAARISVDLAAAAVDRRPDCLYAYPVRAVSLAVDCLTFENPPGMFPLELGSLSLGKGCSVLPTPCKAKRVSEG
jgi:hypothetical protein